MSGSRDYLVLKHLYRDFPLTESCRLLLLRVDLKHLSHTEHPHFM